MYLQVLSIMIKTMKIRNFLLLQLLFFMYSCCSVFSKLASQEEFLSWQFILFYLLAVFLLFLYAILWQQILKSVPLTTAYTNKAVTVIWGMVWGIMLFSETITLNMVIGIVLIVVGEILVGFENGK